MTRASLPVRPFSLGFVCAALAAAACGGTKAGDDDDAAQCPPPSGAAGAAGDDGASDATPADVSGDYTVTLTDTANDCPMVPGWSDGAVMKGILYDIRQDGAGITGQAQGNAALSFIVLTGSNDFTGAVRGDAFTLTDVGPNVTVAGSCSYTVNAVVSGTIDGDDISGTLTYRPVLSADPACNADCEPYACEVVQDFTGTRAPAQ